MAPDPRPVPRFIADNSKEGPPYGRFAERLAAQFIEACQAIDDLPEGAEIPESVEWFPERAWGGRVWVPGSARAGSSVGELEFFGHVSYIQPVDGEPHDFRPHADFTDVLAEDNPEWRIDLNDEVIGKWAGEAKFAADITLIWGRPLVHGSTAVTAEVDDVTVDQEALAGDTFTLIAPDNVQGQPDPLFVEVKLWNRRGEQLASESLYESDDEEEPEDERPQSAAEAAGGGSAQG